MKCKFCASEAKALRSIQSPHSVESYMLYECEACGNRFFDFKEHGNSKEVLEKIYAKIAKRNRGHYHVAFQPSQYWKMERSTIETLLKSSEKRLRVLDIGCRTGDFLMHWPEDCERVGVELSEESASVAEKRGLKIERAFVEDVEFSEAFDVVTCYALMEHLEEPQKVFDVFPGIVRGGGILVLMVPAFDTWKQKHIWRFPEKRWHMYSPPEHLNFFTEEWLEQHLRNDFELVEKKYTSGGMLYFAGENLLLRRLEGHLTKVWDQCSWTNQIPVFDHLYCYFRRR